MKRRYHEARLLQLSAVLKRPTPEALAKVAWIADWCQFVSDFDLSLFLRCHIKSVIRYRVMLGFHKPTWEHRCEEINHRTFVQGKADYFRVVRYTKEERRLWRSRTASGMMAVGVLRKMDGTMPGFKQFHNEING